VLIEPTFMLGYLGLTFAISICSHGVELPAIDLAVYAQSLHAQPRNWCALLSSNDG